jgi:hypothetical protein
MGLSWDLDLHNKKNQNPQTKSKFIFPIETNFEGKTRKTHQNKIFTGNFVALVSFALFHS